MIQAKPDTETLGALPHQWREEAGAIMTHTTSQGDGVC
jgi:hypothetical protein